MNMASLQNTYNQMVAGGSTAGPQDRIMTDMYGMLLNVLSKQSENDAIKEEVKDHGARIRELEAKVGDPSDVSEKLGLAVRNLPLPSPGQSELDNVRAAFNEVRAPGVAVTRDITKAVRVGAKDDYLGTVKVEMLNDDSRASIMKNKKSLAYHQNPAMKSLIIKNLKSEDQMRMENFARDVLQILPGGSNFFVAGNGRLRQKDPRQAQHPPYPHPHHHGQPQRPATPRPAAPFLQGRPVEQGAQHGRYQTYNNQYRAQPPHQPVRVHGQAEEVHQQSHQPQPPNQIFYNYAQQSRGEAHPPPQVQPTNPLDMFDPFQNYPSNPAPLPAVALPGGNLAHDEALPPPQGGHGGVQAVGHDRVVTHGQ